MPFGLFVVSGVCGIDVLELDLLVVFLVVCDLRLFWVLVVNLFCC